MAQLRGPLGQVHDCVSIQVPDGHGSRVSPGLVVALARECPIAYSQQDRQVARPDTVALVRCDQVGISIAVQIADRIQPLFAVLGRGASVAAAKPIGDFVHRHPTVKTPALSFLLLIGVMLVAEGLGQQISRGCIYCAM